MIHGDKLRRTKLDDAGNHFFEHTRDEKILPWREWCRKNMPTGAEGFTHEDIDFDFGDYTAGRYAWILTDVRACIAHSLSRRARIVGRARRRGRANQRTMERTTDMSDETNQTPSVFRCAR